MFQHLRHAFKPSLPTAGSSADAAKGWNGRGWEAFPAWMGRIWDRLCRKPAGSAGFGELDHGWRSGNRDLAAVALDTTASLVVIVDLDCRIIRFNRACERMTGYTFQEVKGRVLSDFLLAPEEKERVISSVSANILAGAQGTVENDWIGRDGRRHRILWTNSVITGNDGGIEYILGTGIDVTEERKMQRALGESDRRFRELADAMPLLIWTARPDGTLDYYNLRYDEVVGTREEPPVAGLWGEVTHPEDRRRCEEIWKAAVESGSPFQIEYRLMDRRLGAYRWYLGRAVPIKDGEGNVLRWYGTSTEIDDLKRAQEDLSDYNQALHLVADAAQELLLSDNPSAMIEPLCRQVMAGIECDVFASYLLVEGEHRLHLNAFSGVAVEATAGIEWLEVGRGISGYVAEKGKRIVAEYIQQSDDTRTQIARSFGLRCYVCHPLKVRERLLGTLAFGSRTRDAFEDYELAVLRVVADLVAGAIEQTRLSDAADAYVSEVEQARRAAESANAAKDQFLAVLSHELRTPLTPALAAAGVAENDTRLPADLREELQMIRRNIEMEKRLIDDLLDLTRIARGKLEMEMGVVDVGAVLRQAARICSIDADAKSVAMTLEVQEGNYVRGDASRLQQVFWNLLNNAVKFTPTDGRITVRCGTDDGQRVVVSVTDTGIGIEAPALTRIFDAFEQQDRGVTRQFGGLGLGLAICKAIVERHGGAIRASSLGRGKGTTMWVQLPRLVDVEAPARGGPPSTTLTPPVDRKLRILLVEDHADTSRIMSQLLQKYGHTVTTANCVGAAVKAAGERSYDLIISDLGLPDGSGLELMRDLHQRLGLKGIALSGYGMEEDVRKSLEAGFAEHMTKPVNMNRLSQVVQAVAAS